MRTKLIAATLACGFLFGLQAAAFAQDLNEHSPLASPRTYDFHAHHQRQGTYDPYNGQFYPPDFQPAWH